MAAAKVRVLQGGEVRGRESRGNGEASYPPWRARERAGASGTSAAARSLQPWPLQREGDGVFADTPLPAFSLFAFISLNETAGFSI